MPHLRGLPYARHNLVLDLAALNKHEMILWDVWGVIDDADAELSADELLADPDVEQLRWSSKPTTSVCRR
ncbi:hypothetical protein OHS58_42375 [Amycolatopsis sp. NBC_00348]|uniref:hypothetical protein n=1 Tax=Amycolatopsis sp. NBC_00348 TaxID=2975956 RepID=UPI002E2621BC